MRKLMGHGKDREITYQSLSWAKQTRLGENSFHLLPINIDLSSEEQRQINTTPFLPAFPGPASLLHPWLLRPAPSSAGGWGMGAAVSP